MSKGVPIGTPFSFNYTKKNIFSINIDLHKKPADGYILALLYLRMRNIRKIY